MSAGEGSGACPRCGAAAGGNFCAQCGSPLAREAGCSHCGAALKPGALYCSECGRVVGERPRKPARAHLPWVLSLLALLAFSVVIALLVQGQTSSRTADMTLTGGVPGAGGGPPAESPAGGAGMPTAEELAAMTPRERADRLFERAMHEHEGGDFERAAFFIDMGLQAYDAVPPADMDADARFHVGLLHLVMGDSVAARGSAETILAGDEDDLLGLLLAARVAEFSGDGPGAERLRERVRDVVAREGGIPDRTDYESHRTLIERVLEGEGG